MGKRWSCSKFSNLLGFKWYKNCDTKPNTAGVMGIYVTRSKKKWLKLRVNISENKQRMDLKFCLAQFVMDMNLVLEYQKKSGDVKFFPRDLTWNYPNYYGIKIIIIKLSLCANNTVKFLMIVIRRACMIHQHHSWLQLDGE